MPNIHPEQLHADVLAAINAWLRQRDINTADNHDGQWRNPAIRARMIHVIRSTRVRTHRIGVITAATEDTADGWAWHYIAHDALTAAADRMNLRDPHITADNDHTYRLTWS
jgi:hypothetical protein